MIVLDHRTLAKEDRYKIPYIVPQIKIFLENDLTLRVP